MQEVTPDRNRTLLLLAGILLANLPFIFLGYGADTDAYRVARSASDLIFEHVYKPSRLPGYPLHEGPFRECVVMCTGHGWEYDVQTGRPPGTSTGHAIARYPVRVEGDEVLIDLDQPLP